MGRIQGDLKERAIQFAEAVLCLSERFPNNNKGWVVGRQLIRSGTSIGANLHEADHGLSDADFAFKCSVARKEASETWYWLELSKRAKLLEGDEVANLLAEADELMRILASIVRKTEEHAERMRQDEQAHGRSTTRR